MKPYTQVYTSYESERHAASVAVKHIHGRLSAGDIVQVASTLDVLVINTNHPMVATAFTRYKTSTGAVFLVTQVGRDFVGLLDGNGQYVLVTLNELIEATVQRLTYGNEDATAWHARPILVDV